MIGKNYDQLPVNQKADILWGEGKLIEAMEMNNFDVALYELDNKYFEIYYSLENNRIEKIRVVHDPKRLKKYKGN
jgi:hypothetical protein